MLYLTGGLVLGETIALWMTAEQVWIGLAALLLVFSGALLRGAVRVRGRGGDRRRRPALFGVIFLIGFGLAVGAFRMEYEEWIVRREQEVIGASEGKDVWVSGLVTEIKNVEYGVRARLHDCELFEGDADGSRLSLREQKIRNLYVYADSAKALCLGMQIAGKGTCEVPDSDRNPGEFDYRMYCLAKKISGIFRAEHLELLNEADESPKPLAHLKWCYWQVREGIRQFGLLLERKLERISEPEDLGVLKAVLLGQKSELDEGLYSLYRKNGIAHILAISGLHVSIGGMGIWRILRAIGMGYMESGCIAFVVLLGYGTMVGFGPSVIRAVFMLGVSFCAGILGRTYDLPSAMCVPAMGILLSGPFMLTQASFQLSFLAVGAMFVPGNVLAKQWEWKGIRETVWISLSLQMVTLPFVLLHSYEVPVFGVFLNFVVVPLMSYVLISGIFGVAGSFVWEGIGILMLGGAHWILELYECLCQGMQQIPNANAVLGVPSTWKLLAYFGLIMGGTWMMFRFGKRWLLLWGIGVLVLLPWSESGLSVTILDVGQGDGIFLEAEGRTMLVDCGSSQKQELGEKVLIPFLKSQGVDQLDTIVVTHGDQDHISGIRELLEDNESGIDIGQLIVSESGMTDAACKELEDLAQLRKIPVRMCEAGDSFTGVLGDSVEILCLNPVVDGKKAQEAASDRNAESIVLHISYGAFSMLLTGDIGIREEEELLERYDLSPVTVLKAAHHGSANSSSREFLDSVKPAYAIFSYGEGNSYGHPAPGVVDRCRELGAQVWETAESGAIRLWTDGNHLRIYGWLDRQGGI